MTLYYNLFYPDMDLTKQEPIEIGLSHVRAGDPIRIKYDFDRDGWVVFQNSYTTEGEDLEDWKEVSFIKAWAREVE